MAVVGFNHFNIRAPKALMAETRAFYVEVVGLEEGFRPEFDFAGHWLYLGDLAVLHLMEWRDDEAPSTGKPYLDHVAFTCEGLDQIIAGFEQQGVEFSRRDVEVPNVGGFTQLNLTDPTGTGVELNFAW